MPPSELPETPLRARRIVVRTQSFASNVSALVGTDLVASLPARLLPRLAPRGYRSFDILLALSPIEYRLVWHRRCDADPAGMWLRERVALIAGSAPGEEPATESAARA